MRTKKINGNETIDSNFTIQRKDRYCCSSFNRYWLLYKVWVGYFTGVWRYRYFSYFSRFAVITCDRWIVSFVVAFCGMVQAIPVVGNSTVYMHGIAALHGARVCTKVVAFLWFWVRCSWMEYMSNHLLMHRAYWWLFSNLCTCYFHSRAKHHNL